MNNYLEILLAELEANCLEVVLVPSKRFANEGGMIRVAQQKNAEWYRRFCARHSSDRRRKNSAPDTRIKRAAIICILRRLVAGKKSNSKYAAELHRISASYFRAVT